MDEIIKNDDEPLHSIHQCKVDALQHDAPAYFPIL